MNETVKRIVEANPVDGDSLPDDDFVDSAALFSSIVTRRDAMTGTRIKQRDAVNEGQLPWYRKPALVALGAAMAVVIAVGGTALVFNGTDEPSVASEPAAVVPSTAESDASTTVPDTVTTTVPAPVFADDVTVVRVVDDALEGAGMRIWSIAVGGPGLVAVGEVNTPDDIDSVWGGPSMDSVVLISADGQSWDRVDDPVLFGGDDWDELHSVWGGSTGLIAQGRDAEAPYPDVVWYQSANGIDWALIVDQDLYDAWETEWRSGSDPFFEFVATEDGWVAALYGEASEPVATFTSADGIEWAITTDPTGTPSAGDGGTLPPEMDAWGSGDSFYGWNVATDGNEAVAVRYHARPKVGVTTDGGQAWTQVDPNSFGNDPLLTAIDVVYHQGRYIVVGNSEANAEVWLLDWTK